MSKKDMLSMTSRQVVLPPLAHHEQQLSRDSMLSLLGMVAALIMQACTQQICCFHSTHRTKKLAAAHK